LQMVDSMTYGMGWLRPEFLLANPLDMSICTLSWPRHVAKFAEGTQERGI
jgi:hypothetical protein